MPAPDTDTASVVDKAHEYMFGNLGATTQHSIAQLTGLTRRVQSDVQIELAGIYLSEFYLGRAVAEQWGAQCFRQKHRLMSADGCEDDETPMASKQTPNAFHLKIISSALITQTHAIQIPLGHLSC